MNSSLFQGWRSITPRTALAALLLILVLSALIYELGFFVPQLQAWHPFDYEMYVHWGTLLRQGTIDHYYPLPTTIWVFLPLSFMPDWFKFIFAIAPFLFVLKMFGRRGLILWLYFPLLTQTQYAQLDGWMLFPLLWLLRNRSFWGPLGAVLLWIKPILAPFAIACAVFLWLRQRRWNMLAQHVVMLTIFVLPAFVIDPLWPLHFIQALPLRATTPYLQFRGVSVWTWWQRGGVAQHLFPFLIAAMLALSLHVLRRKHSPIAIAELWNQFFFPFLYEANLTLTIPLAVSTREIIVITVVSWISVGLDTIAGGWGGAYALIPLSALIIVTLNLRVAERSRNPAP